MADESCERFEYQLPDEWRLDHQLNQFSAEFGDRAKAVDTHHFLTERGDLAEQFKGKKTYLMESFYRRMRKAHDILMEPGMDGPEPAGGKWNYDATNRKKLPKGHRPVEPLTFDRDLTDVGDHVARLWGRDDWLGGCGPFPVAGHPGGRARAARLLCGGMPAAVWGLPGRHASGVLVDVPRADFLLA